MSDARAYIVIVRRGANVPAHFKADKHLKEYRIMATGKANRTEQGGTDPNKAAPAQKTRARKPKVEETAEQAPAPKPQPYNKAPAKQEKEPEVAKPDPRKTEEAKAPKRPEVKPEELNEHHQYLGKYADRQRRAEEAGLEFDPNWRYRDTVLLPGTPPASETSVMGHVYKIAKEAGKAGITGAELAVKLRHTPNIAARSKYTVGLPPVGWSEDYVNGALAKSPGILRISPNQPAKSENSGESKDEG